MPLIQALSNFCKDSKIIIKKDKQGTRFRAMGNETYGGVVRNLGILQDRPMLSHINGKLSSRTLHWHG